MERVFLAELADVAGQAIAAAEFGEFELASAVVEQLSSDRRTGPNRPVSTSPNSFGRW